MPVLSGTRLNIVAENGHYDYHFDILMLGQFSNNYFEYYEING